MNGTVNMVQNGSMRQWDVRLGHLGENGMRELIKKGLISFTNKQEKLQACEE